MRWKGKWLGCIKQCKILQTQILSLVPDKWSQMYCSEYFNALTFLVWNSHEIKNVGWILAKHAPKKGKTIINETLDLVTNVYEDDNFSG